MAHATVIEPVGDGVGRVAVALFLLAPLLACAPGALQQEALFFAPKAFVLGIVVVLAVVASRGTLVSSRLDGLDVAIVVACAAGIVGTLCGATTLRHAAPMHALEVSFAVACLVLRRRDLGASLDGALVVACALVSAVALLEACGLVIFEGIPRRPLGLLGNRNAVAGYLAIGLPLLVMNTRRRSPLRLVVCFAVGVVIGLSRCRGAWLAVAVAAVVGAVMSSRERVRFDGRLAAIAVLGGLLGVLVPWPGLHWIDDGSMSAAHVIDAASGSGRGRIEQWIVGGRAFLEAPVLGVGPRAWGIAAAVHAHAVPDHHAARWLEEVTPASDVLRWIVERGAVGVAACAAVMLFAIRRLTALGDPTTRAALFGGFGALAVLATVDTPLLRGDVLALVACLIGRAAPVRAVGPRDALGRSRMRALAIAAIVATALSGARAAAGLLTHADDLASRRLADALSVSAETRLAILEKVETPAERRDAALALLELSPGAWGARLVAAGALNATGDRDGSRAMVQSIDRIEPHWRELGPTRRAR